MWRFRERLVVLKRTLKGRPSTDFVACFGATEEGFRAELVDVVYSVVGASEGVEIDFNGIIDLADDSSTSLIGCCAFTYLFCRGGSILSSDSNACVALSTACFHSSSFM